MSQNKRFHFEHVWDIKTKLKKYNGNIFGGGLGRNLITGQKVDKKFIDDYFQAEKTGKKKEKGKF